MCGIAGFAGIKSRNARFGLIYGMGLGVDTRGGHAAGFVGKAGGRTKLAKVIGTWDDASVRFYETAASCESLVMHARYATCGVKDDTEHAHPFVIRQPDGTGRARLYGVHNGVIWNADESAKRHGRPYTVDSKEVLHLVADGRTKELQKLRGYGTLAWMTPHSDRVHLVKLTSSADLEICSVKGGGMAYGSTRAIIKAGLDCAGLDVDEWYRQIDVGRVHFIDATGLYHTPLNGYSVGGWGSWTSAYIGGARSAYSGRYEPAYSSRYDSAADYFSRSKNPRVRVADDDEPLFTKEEAQRILRTLDGSENDPTDVEDEEDYSNAIIDDGWDPRFQRAYKRLMGT